HTTVYDMRQDAPDFRRNSSRRSNSKLSFAFGESYLRLGGIAQRKRFGKVFLGEDPGFEPIGNLIVLLLEQDAAGDAGECFPDRRHIGMRFPVPLAEVLLIDQVTVAHHYPEAGSSRRPQQGLAEKAGEERKMLSPLALAGDVDYFPPPGSGAPR